MRMLWMALLLPLSAQAAELRIGGEIGLRDEDRLVKIEYIRPLSRIFDIKGEFGGSGPLRYVGASIGIKAEEGSFFVRYWLGPAITNVVSDQLSSQFQFNHDLELGIKASNGVEFYTGYKHMSNGGLVPPNLGRDWVGVGIGVHW